MSTIQDTDALIASLTDGLAPVGRHPLGRRLGLGLAAGAVVTLLMVVAGLHLRPDLWLAMHGATFWMKWGYTGSLAALAVTATLRLARPDADVRGWLWVMALPMAGLAVIGAVELAKAPPSHWLAMWLGHSWRVCSSLVFLLSLPIFAGLLWSFRRMAPTRLRLAGAAAGLCAGAWSATLYCLHCPEVSAIFVLTWYTLGMALAAALGAVLGPRLLRW
jgi:hypothetical protein